MFKINDTIYLRLHKNYFLFSKFDKKFSNQYVKFFLVKRKVNRFVRELNKTNNKCDIISCFFEYLKDCES